MAWNTIKIVRSSCGNGNLHRIQQSYAKGATDPEFVWGGLNTCEIGDVLKVSIKTVEVHRAQIMKKLHARNTAQMIKLGIESGHIVLQDAC